MSTFVALDFGETYVGVAVGNAASRLVSPIDTLRRRSDGALIADLIELAAEHEAEEFVIGLPCRLDGSEGDMADRVRSFKAKLDAQTPLPTHLASETLTSRAARERIAEITQGQSVKKRGPKRLQPHHQVDAVAAQIIGEQYLSQGGKEVLA